MRTIRRRSVSTICGFMMAVIINPPVWAQDSLAQYHPLDKGNIWIYQITHPWGNNYYQRREVTGDSTIGGRQYRIIAETNTADSISRTSLERYDVSTGNYFIWSGSNDVLQDSAFTSIPNASFSGNINNRIFKRLSTETVFGTQRATREITEGNIIKEDVISWSYAYGLGLVHAEDLQLVNYIPSWVQTLVYAKIDGREYGKAPMSDSLLRYYPLAVGNRWHYTISGGFTAASSMYVSVIKDTVLSNGKTYFKVEHRTPQDVSYDYERIDSSSFNVFRVDLRISAEEELLDSLRAKAGDTVSSRRLSTPRVFCDSITSRTTLGVPTQWKYFSGRVIGTFPQYALAQGLGLVYNSFVEEDPVYPRYSSRVTALVYARINGVEYGTPLSVDEGLDHAPVGYFLGQNYPNPFNPSTTISFTISSRSHVSLKIYDVMGREVATLAAEVLPSGTYSRTWNASGISSGVYFYRLQAGSYMETKRLLLLR